MPRRESHHCSSFTGSLIKRKFLLFSPLLSLSSAPLSSPPSFLSSWAKDLFCVLPFLRPGPGRGFLWIESSPMQDGGSMTRGDEIPEGDQTGEISESLPVPEQLEANWKHLQMKA